MAAGDNDRYAGISQTVRVVKGAKYKFSLRGMIRTSNQEGDPWRYSVQVGYLDGPNADRRDVENWTDVGWNTYYDRRKTRRRQRFYDQLCARFAISLPSLCGYGRSGAWPVKNSTSISTPSN